jgi:hypothetical protein
MNIETRIQRKNTSKQVCAFGSTQNRIDTVQEEHDEFEKPGTLCRIRDKSRDQMKGTGIGTTTKEWKQLRRRTKKERQSIQFCTKDFVRMMAKTRILYKT